jgi:hypothetical protein
MRGGPRTEGPSLVRHSRPGQVLGSSKFDRRCAGRDGRPSSSVAAAGGGSGTGDEDPAGCGGTGLVSCCAEKKLCCPRAVSRVAGLGSNRHSQGHEVRREIGVGARRAAASLHPCQANPGPHETGPTLGFVKRKPPITERKPKNKTNKTDMTFVVLCPLS